jgi:hypothetical protein
MLTNANLNKKQELLLRLDWHAEHAFNCGVPAVTTFAEQRMQTCAAQQTGFPVRKHDTLQPKNTYWTVCKKDAPLGSVSEVCWPPVAPPLEAV